MKLNASVFPILRIIKLQRDYNYYMVPQLSTIHLFFLYAMDIEYIEAYEPCYLLLLC